MDLKTKTSTGLSVSSGGRSHLATGKTNGGLELKLPVQHVVPFTVKVRNRGHYVWTEHGNSLNDTGYSRVFELSSILCCKFQGKWTTENVFHTELVIEDQIVVGSKIAFETAYAPASGKKTGKVKAAYKADHVHTNVGEFGLWNLLCCINRLSLKRFLLLLLLLRTSLVTLLFCFQTSILTLPGQQ